MSIALPVSQPEEAPHNDPRHYTAWSQVKAPAQIVATPLNPIPEDPGTVIPHDEKHYTEWVPK